MTLIRRTQKPDPYAGSDIENPPRSSLSTLSSSSVSSSTATPKKARSLDRCAVSMSSELRRMCRQRRIKRMDATGPMFYSGISALGLSVFVALGVVVVMLQTASHFASPGKNYLDTNYWRRSHSLSLQQIHDLRHNFPAYIDAESTNEMESIVHPGYFLADKERMNGLFNGTFEVENITVPKFWDPVDTFGEFEGGVREFLGSRGKYLITPSEASAVGSFYNDERTIFLAIASYRDPECLPTVESVFARAKHPERLRIAIIDQRKEGEDDPSCRPPSESLCRTSPDSVLCEHIAQINYLEYPSTLMVGPVFARHLANRMYRGEFFAMQVDSHVRFVADWDEDIIDQWESTGNEMAVLSTYMTDIGKHNIDPETHVSLVAQRSMMCDFEYEWTGSMTHIKFNKQPQNIPKVKDSPMLHPFWAAGFSFGRGHFLVSVPYDHYLPFVFQGEEILQTIRGFTFGYDYYAPSRNVAFHIYAMRHNAEKRQNIPKFTENEVLFGAEAKKQAYLRLIGISGTSDPTPEFLHLEEERYGLGRIRSREQFFDIFGIDPRTRTTEGNLCEFVQGLPVLGAPKSMHANFKRFLRFDKMGIDYSRITYRHKTPERKITKIEEKELSSLQEQLREMMKEREKNSTASVDGVYRVN